MTQKKKPHLKVLGRHDEPKKKRRNKAKVKQPKTPMERVMIMGPTGKTRMEWRPWA